MNRSTDSSEHSEDGSDVILELNFSAEELMMMEDHQKMVYWNKIQSDFKEIQEIIIEMQEKAKVTDIECTKALKQGQNTLDYYYDMKNKFNNKMEKIINKYGYRGRRHLRIVE